MRQSDLSNRVERFNLARGVAYVDPFTGVYPGMNRCAVLALKGDTRARPPIAVPPGLPQIVKTSEVRYGDLSRYLVQGSTYRLHQHLKSLTLHFG